MRAVMLALLLASCSDPAMVQTPPPQRLTPQPVVFNALILKAGKDFGGSSPDAR